MLINIIVWIVLGGIAGWLASLIMGKDASMGTIATCPSGESAMVSMRAMERAPNPNIRSVHSCSP